MYLLSGTLFSPWQEGRAVPREQEFRAEDDLYPMELEPVYNGKRTLLFRFREGTLGVGEPLSKKLTLFMAKLCDFQYPISDLVQTDANAIS